MLANLTAGRCRGQGYVDPAAGEEPVPLQRKIIRRKANEAHGADHGCPLSSKDRGSELYMNEAHPGQSGDNEILAVFRWRACITFGRPVE